MADTAEPTNTARRYSVEIRDMINGKWRVIVGDWGEKFINQNADSMTGIHYYAMNCDNLPSATIEIDSIIRQRELEKRK